MEDPVVVSKTDARQASANPLNTRVLLIGLVAIIAAFSLIYAVAW